MATYVGMSAYLERNLIRSVLGRINSRKRAIHGSNYRQAKSMFYNKKYAPGTPNPKVARFTTGKFSDDYDYKLELVSLNRLQIRSNALEAARVAASKKLAAVGEEACYLRVVSYPFVVMR